LKKNYSVAFKQKMVTRLIGHDAISANRLAKQTGVSQNSLSKWHREARSLPDMTRHRKTWTLERKMEIMLAASKLQGDQLLSYLDREGLTLAELDLWRGALDDAGGTSVVAARQVRKLERELARKDKALAEAAALLILKKKLEDYYSVDEAERTDEENEK
jgi:transposase-like protein